MTGAFTFHVVQLGVVRSQDGSGPSITISSDF